MSVYYIAMEIYVFIYILFFSPFYYLYIISIPHHAPTMDFSLPILKPFKTKISILLTIIFYEILYSYNNLFLLSEGVSKGHKHPLIY
jgi:hypothetical protein